MLQGQSAYDLAIELKRADLAQMIKEGEQYKIPQKKLPAPSMANDEQTADAVAVGWIYSTVDVLLHADRL